MTKLEDVINDPNYRKVLDHGFVGLVDHMGSDNRIAQAARTSYGKGTKSVRGDRALVRYLVKHQHTSPLEQCVLTFHIKLPIFVMRQLVRHRTACLTGDNNLWFTPPNQVNKVLKPNTVHKISIEKFYKMWHNGNTQVTKTNSRTHKIDLTLIEDNTMYTTRQISMITGYHQDKIANLLKSGKVTGEKIIIKGLRRGKTEWQFTGKDFKEFVKKNNEKTFIHTHEMRARLQKMNIRCLNEETNEIIHTNITDIWQNGAKSVYKVEFQNGKNITMTKDHLCYTSIGWETLENALNLQFFPNKEVKQWGDDVLFATNGIIKEVSTEKKVDGRLGRPKSYPIYPNKENIQFLIDQNYSNDEIIGMLGLKTVYELEKNTEFYNIKRTAEQINILNSKAHKGKGKPRGPMSGQALENVRKARSGSASNWWKGGVSLRNSKREIFLYQVRQDLYKENKMVCAMTGSAEHLQLHHIDPVWNNKEREYDKTNCIPLCKTAHMKIYYKNLDLKFLDYYNEGKDLTKFFEENNLKLDYLPEKKYKIERKKKEKRTALYNDWSKVVKITYLGEQMTYDLSVEGPYHNFVCNGVVVHNSINELSGRYSELPNEFYLPELENIKPQSQTNKQGREGELTDDMKDYVLTQLRGNTASSYGTYQDLLTPETADESGFEEDYPGLSRELARMVLPVNIYTECYWTINLRNFFHCYGLRADSHAQWEIQEFAKAKLELVEPLFPFAVEAARDYMWEARSQSRMERSLLKDLTKHDISLKTSYQVHVISAGSEDNLMEQYGMNKREFDEFKTEWGLNECLQLLTPIVSL